MITTNRRRKSSKITVTRITAPRPQSLYVLRDQRGLFLSLAPPAEGETVVRKYLPHEVGIALAFINVCLGG